MATTAPTIDNTPDRAHPGMTWPRALLAMTRPAQIVLIVGIFANGALLAVWSGGAGAGSIVDAWPALLLLIIASASVHLANEAADHETDRLTRRTPFSGGSGALEASDLDPSVPLALSMALGIVVLIGAAAAFLLDALPGAAAVLLMVGLGGGLAYSLKPLAVERHGWGEPLNAVLGALVLPLFGVAAIAANVTLSNVIAFLPFFCVTLASVLATAWPDREADAATGKITLQVRLQPTQLRRIALLAAAGFIGSSFLSMAAGAMPLAILGLLVTPLLVVGLVHYTRVESPIANVVAMVGLTVITFAALSISLVADGKLL